ncbi:hypothetical protein [Bacillus cereus group sp. Bc002]
MHQPKRYEKDSKTKKRSQKATFFSHHFGVFL